MSIASLKQKFNSKKAKIAVVGLGYVGLPIAVKFAKKGFPVVGIDLNEKRVSQITNRYSYISDVPTKELAGVVKKGLLTASTDFAELSSVDVVIICVPTPLKSKYAPDIKYIMSAVTSIRKNMKKETLIILESTTYPGTTEEMIKPELEKDGMKCGKDFFLAFSPERIDPGNKDYDVTQIPKVVGGLTPESGELTKVLYEKVIAKIHLVSSSKAAEMTKLLENTFRIVNIGWANEVAMMCHKMGIDVWEVIDAADTKPFGFMPFYPGLGVGGHCIPDDPLYLYWKAKHQGFASKYIKLSADINSGMPAYTVDCIAEALKANKKKLKGAKILVEGVTYKKDVRDLRKSPPLKLMELLEEAGAKVDYYDPIIPYLDLPWLKNKESVEPTAKNLKSYDMVVIATDHTDVNYDHILKNSNLIFDIKNIYKNKKSKKIVKF